MGGERGELEGLFLFFCVTPRRTRTPQLGGNRET
jgi:hypothetical protein